LRRTPRAREPAPNPRRVRRRLRALRARHRAGRVAFRGREEEEEARVVEKVQQRRSAA